MDCCDKCKKAPCIGAVECNDEMNNEILYCNFCAGNVDSLENLGYTLSRIIQLLILKNIKEIHENIKR